MKVSRAGPSPCWNGRNHEQEPTSEPAQGGQGPSQATGPSAASDRAAAAARAVARRALGPVPKGTGSSSGTGLGGEQVEGVHAVRELLLAGRRRTHEMLVSTERDGAGELADIRELAAQYSVSVQEVGRSKLASVARTSAPQGVVARAAPLPEESLDDLLPPDAPSQQPAPFLLACDGITDPGNLGALLRTAECAGVTGVVLPRHRAVHVTPAVTKAAAGAVEHLRFAVVGGLPAALKQVTERGALTVGLDMGGSVSIHDLPPVDGPVVVVVGAEGRGLGRLAGERCDVVASVPMAGAVESLNVSVAGALALYEVVRRRTAR
ncbi:MAG: 23S rRNA (guanosine(2251)-2'-O)-methyltransferase RlmB [Acidimicrobiales bacterium]|nr:23S rRNA (guanosine(2251)-2'-O)-methyltransferase RlmB [Acidimicrobiales bacterium]